MEENVQQWYASFVDNMELNMLFDLTIAANFMDIQPLLELTNATLAAMIKGKSPEELRAHFRIITPYVPPDEAAVRAKHKWAEYPDCIVPAAKPAVAPETSASTASENEN